MMPSTSRCTRASRLSDLLPVAVFAVAAAVTGGSTAFADALSSPSMTAPLSANANPFSFDTASPIGKVYVSGQLTGLGLIQSNHTADPFGGSGNATGLFDISNGQVEIQTTSGPLQFFLEAGAYTFPALGAPYIRAGKNTSNLFGALPVAYAKYVVTPEISIQAGELPTLIGAEYAFTFQNMNIERGLLWNQENVVNKGVQANYAKGPLTASLSINDGFDSDHYNWVTGLVTWAFDSANSLTFDGGANFASTITNKFQAPNTLSNSSIFDASYSWTKGQWLVNPYFQYTHVNKEDLIGQAAADSYSGAVLAKYTFTPTFSVAGRVEYISTHSDSCPAVAANGGDGGVVAEDLVSCSPTNLLYGPSSNAFSVTATPTYQKGLLFVRAEISYTRADSVTDGFAFGTSGDKRDQVRGLIETGFLF